jgi:hypothetical protein
MTNRMRGWTKIILGAVIILLSASFARAVDLSFQETSFFHHGFVADTLYGQLVLIMVCLGIVLIAVGAVPVCKEERSIWLLIAGFTTGGVLLLLVKPLLYGSLVIVHGTGSVVLLAWPCLAVVALAFVLVGFVRLIRRRV